MQIERRLLIVGLLMAATAPAEAQPMGMGGGRGPGMMRQGPGMVDPAAYLDGLKAKLKITAMQEAAWSTYAAAVKTHADQMKAQHQTMFEAMGTATWQERRNMMDTMFATRQQAMTAVHDAAATLSEALTPAQRQQAQGILPGLMGRGGPMMGRGSATP